MRTYLTNFIVLSFWILFLSSCQNQSTEPEIKLTKNWQLNVDLSSLSFITTKNKTITEQHSLKFKQGHLHERRIFNAVIDLNTIDTMIPIRDERLRDILFETDQFPTAEIKASIPTNLNFNNNTNTSIPFELNLHGKEKSLQAEVMIQMVDEKLVVTNYNPITVNAKDFALDDAINELTQIASLQGINYDVQVDFKLTFEIN